MEVVKEELEISGGMRVHRSLAVILAGPTSNMTSFIPRPTILALTRRETGSHLQFGCDVFTLASMKHIVNSKRSYNYVKDRPSLGKRQQQQYI